MNTTGQPPEKDGDMPAEIDFSNATRGKFYRPNATLKLPVYLDADVQDYLVRVANRKKVPVSAVANDLLKREIDIIEAMK